MVEEENVTQTSVSGLPVELNSPSVNRRRERRIYYRKHFDKDGNFIGWFPTLPLPADMWHMQYYAQKGFRLNPPGADLKEEKQPVAPTVGELKPSQPEGITCPVEGCGTVVKSFIGLARHMAKKHSLK